MLLSVSKESMISDSGQMILPGHAITMILNKHAKKQIGKTIIFEYL